MAKSLKVILLTASVIACSSFNPSMSAPNGRAFTEADILFQRDPRWLGADAALSVPLSEGRILLARISHRFAWE